MSPGASQWEPATYLNYSCLVAVEGEPTVEGEPNKVVGFLVFRETAPGEQEILSLAVEPAARGRGVARRLLKSVLAPRQGAWFLEVRETNLGAIHLYETMGFRQTSKRNGYYHNPSESGIVMQFNS
jgi:ribosomal-protein-alanine N-acetyltransferase